MKEAQDKWDQLQRKINAAIAEWRAEHPEATLTEIEEAVDSRVSEIRTQMVQDLALQGKTTDLTGMTAEERPRCPECGRPVQANGKQQRRLISKHGKRIELERSQAYCQHCRVTFFPSG